MPGPSDCDPPNGNFLPPCFCIYKIPNIEKDENGLIKNESKVETPLDGLFFRVPIWMRNNKHAA
jgi:hypothetical protein